MTNYHDINVLDSDDDTRFSQMVDDKEIKTRKLTRLPKSTRDSNDWGVNTWREWATWRNRKLLEKDTNDEEYKGVPLIDEVILDNKELGYWLARFVLEVRRRDKKPYPAESLWNICCAIQRFLRQFNCSLHIFDKSDPHFNEFARLQNEGVERKWCRTDREECRSRHKERRKQIMGK